MKKTVILIMLLVVCVGCTSEDKKTGTNNKEVTIANGYKEGAKVLKLPTSQADLTINIQNAQELYNDSESIALVHIDTIDGGSNYSEVSKSYVYPYTYGKMTVQQVYKGDITNGSQVNYYRLGGIIPFDEYYKGLNEAQKNKFNTTINEQEPDYIQEKFTNDIDIEVGKTYLVYLKTGDYYKADPNGYGICGFEGGLREIEGNGKARSGLKVYNNFTKEWESMEQVLPK